MHSLKVIPSSIFFNGKGKNDNFVVDKPGGHHFTQAIKVNISSNKTYQHHTPLMSGTEKGRVSVVSFPVVPNLIHILMKNQTNYSERHSPQ